VTGKLFTTLLAERYQTTHQNAFGFALGADASRFLALALELHGRRKDGTEFPLELSLSSWKSNEQIFYSTVLRDLTERNSTQERLEQLRRQNELLLNSAAEGMLGVDLQGLVTFANPAAARMLGDYVNEMLGMPFDRMLRHSKEDGAVYDRFNSPIQAALENGAMHNSSVEYFHKKDGTKFPVEYTVTAVRHQAQLTGALLVFKNIIERKAAEETLREQAALLDNAHDAICVIDLDAKIKYWNKSAAALYGWTSSEALGRDVHDVLIEPTTLESCTAFRRMIEEKAWQGELDQMTKNAKRITVESRWTLLHTPQGAPKSILVVNTDISETKRSAAQFRHAQRLESMGRLASGIAHDLNNVLAPILMITSMLRSKLTERDRSFLEMIETSAKRGADMVRQILSFSRGVEGLESTVQISRLIQDQARLARQTFPPSIDIRTHAPKNLWSVTGNTTQLFQVLLNLCINARDAMPDGGVLMLQAENVTLDPDYARDHPDATPGPKVLLTVSDTGFGISPETMGKIYDPFFTTKPEGKGTGLGLSTVLGIVKNHHGHMEVKSDPGKGTTMKIFLPGQDLSPPPLEDEGAVPAPRGKGEWVLVADNEEAFLTIATAALERSGYRVLPAKDGTDALARYARHKDKIRLVITDLLMPFLNGEGMIRAIKEMNPTVKILAISGMDVGYKPRPAGELGIPFLAKPFSCAELVSRVHEALADEPSQK
jgi:two-component system cell cycle sensor histidine kinase/response regulator CckA